MTARRRSATLGVLVCALLALLLWLLLRGPADLQVALEVKQPIVPVGGTTEIVATVREGGRPVSGVRCRFEWSTTAGSFVGGGDRVVLIVPSAGKIRVSLTARKGRAAASAGADVFGTDDRTVAAIDRERGTAEMKVEPPAPPPAEMDGPPPVIDEIRLEKTSVCKGESVLVTVKAHDPRGADRDPFIGYVIDGHPGQSLPIPYFGLGHKNQATPRVVMVYGKDNRSWTTKEIPPVEVRDCEVKRSAKITYSLVPNRQDEFRFKVELRARPGQPAFTPQSYQWDFGDGAAETTTEPFAQHSYLHRPQTAIGSTFLITVAITSAEGEKLVGREGLSLQNHYFIQRDPQNKHYVGLVIELEPRFPERGSDGYMRQDVFIWHHDKDPVHITKVVSNDYTNQGDQLPEVKHDPAAFLGTADIPPSGITLKAALDPGEQEYIVYRRFVLEGQASDGVKVYGSFSLMTPPRLDRRTAKPVMDNEMKVRIIKAQQLLGKQQVTDEDLQQLVERGLLPPYTPPEQRRPGEGATPRPAGAPAAGLAKP
jgi:hypothetical protein